VLLINNWGSRFDGPLPRAPEKRVTTKKKVHRPSIVSPLRTQTQPLGAASGFSLYAVASFRKCGTPFETHGERLFRKNNLAYAPPAWKYAVGMYYVVLDALTSLGEAGELAQLFAKGEMSLLSRIREMGLLTLSSGFWQRSYFGLCYSWR
jgi:hypothetical protein